MRPAFNLPRIKVCGLRRSSEVEAAVTAGADAIGLVAVRSSPRFIEVQDARDLVAALPAGMHAIAVFADAPASEVLTWMRATGADAVQLCGNEQSSQWRNFPAPILRRLAVDNQADDELERWRSVAAGFVLDHPSQPGGSGLEVQTDHAAALCKAAACMLAGGLDAENVAARIRSVVPRGVDASSRLEDAAGRKDVERIRAFVLAALAAFEELQR
jgi:phosphoribosylanthranilate isomerase